MTLRKTTIGLCLLGTMLVSAVAVPAAGAQTNATAWGCVSTAEAKHQYSDSRCTVESSGGNTGKWTKQTGTANTPATGTAESEGTTVFKATTGGVSVELTSTSLSGTGSGENKVNEGGIMEATGTGTIEFQNVSANHSCLVNGVALATITTEKMRTHTLSTTEVKFEPASGTTFATFTLTGCAISALNKTWVISGSDIGTVNGDKIQATHTGTTGQGTLKANTSINAGIEGVLIGLNELGGAMGLE